MTETKNTIQALEGILKGKKRVRVTLRGKRGKYKERYFKTYRASAPVQSVKMCSSNTHIVLAGHTHTGIHSKQDEKSSRNAGLSVVCVFSST